MTGVTASVSAVRRFSSPLAAFARPTRGRASFSSQSGRRLSVSFCHSSQRLLPIAAGNRHRESGALTNVGTEGDYWSSSSNYAGSNNAGNLNFRSSNVYPLNNTNRANGLSVRCVQHLRLFFIFRPGASR